MPISWTEASRNGWVALLPTKQKVQHDPKQRGEEDDDRPQERRLLAVVGGIGVRPDDQGELDNQRQDCKHHDKEGCWPGDSQDDGGQHTHTCRRESQIGCDLTPVQPQR